ncbi:MAG: hypothetical protein J7M14_01135, partial [Planctomycetes bacterium]|nr:hypothetical protein [Planctomycetota bacterium]
MDKSQCVRGGLFWSCFTLWIFVACTGVGAAEDPAGLVPQDVFTLTVIDDIKATVENFKRTSLYELYKDQAMQQFMGPAVKNIRKMSDEKV